MMAVSMPIIRLETHIDAPPDTVASRSSLADPTSLDWYEQFAASRCNCPPRAPEGAPQM